MGLDDLNINLYLLEFLSEVLISFYNIFKVVILTIKVLFDAILFYTSSLNLKSITTTGVNHKLKSR